MYFTTNRKFSKTLPVVSFVILLIAATLAFAHSTPVSMAPAKDSTVSTPANVTVHFSEAMEPKLSSLTLADASGAVVSKEPSVVSAADAKMMTLPLPTLAAGVYTVNWVTVALDSHKAQGKYNFTIK